ncbi:MAG TPA: acetate/propionate family kinase [Myxococcales bacterium]|nr:acetate/propionate family kinase [Myxococcales bacterium]HIN85122.1 acetate/propionate family kinase [Myxococcales bacterium]
MRVLVVNCGSSSIKAAVLDSESGERQADISVERLGTSACIALDGSTEIALPGYDHGRALAELLPRLAAAEPTAVGHRVVHGGERFSAPAEIDNELEAELESLSPLAPLHNPANLAGIRAARLCLPDIPHVAVFDTAFHSTLPRRAQRYALPLELTQKHGLRRYGFHGTSHSWVAARAAQFLNDDTARLRIITCHLGNGASVCAVEYGRSVETSMGMTPVEGLVMGTRSGDMDPGILIELMRSEGLSVDELDELLNRKSGLTGLSGVGRDLRDIEARAAEGDDNCRMAIAVSTHRLRKYIGAYAAVMGGVDAIVFTAGIGENSATIRHRAAGRFSFLGAHLDEERNRAARVSREDPVAEISASHSKVRILVVATDEAHSIAASTAELLEQASLEQGLTIPVAISGRHIHLTQDAVETLFGPGHTLTPYKPLSQPGQFASEERLTIVGPRSRIEKVRVLGPVRRNCQVEISRTDEFKLGIDAPVRNSGDVDNSPGVTLIGPAGKLDLTQGLICARRHIHMTPEDAERFGVNDRDVVEVAIESAGRDLTFGDVLIRVKSSYALEMHIDTDEANAAEVQPGQQGVLAATPATASLRRRR